MVKSQMMKLVVALLFIKVGMILSFTPINIASRPVRTESVAGKGYQDLICKKKALELGIVLHSTSSYRNRNFKAAIKFLQDFLRQFEISSKPKGVRVSIITYGRNVYPEIGFNLTTYTTSDQVINAIGKIPHKAGQYSDTGKAISFMRKYLLAKNIVRPRVPRVGIVITDGISLARLTTLKAAEDARNEGIIMFAIGVGKVRDSELLNIAGDDRRVTNVDKYKRLNNIKESLAAQICVVETKPPTPPPNSVDELKFPVDIIFVYDEADLGIQYTKWAKRLTQLSSNNKLSKQEYRKLIHSDLCPYVEGFNLDSYDNADSIKKKLDEYDRSKVLPLLQSIKDVAFSIATGARQDSCKVAVIIAEGRTFNELNNLHDEVAAIKKRGIHVILADPTDKSVDVPGAVVLRGRSAKEQADDLLSVLSHLCYNQKQRE